MEPVKFAADDYKIVISFLNSTWILISLAVRNGPLMQFDFAH